MHGHSFPSRGGLLACAQPLARAYDLVLLDLDGVLYIGPDAVAGAPEAIRAARESGMRACFVTNNASRPAAAVAEHLTRLGVPAAADEVVTSAQAAAAMLAERLPPDAAVLVVGGKGLRVALTEQGLVPVSSMDERPQAVVQGFNPDLSWRDLAEGTRAVRSGLFWMATNLDLTVPTPSGPAPGNGALVGLIADVVGRPPDAVAGKPRPGAFREAAHRYRSVRPLVVGDRLDTDLEGARAADQDGLLVLTGVSGATDVLACPPHRRPGYLGRDLSALHHPHPPVAVQQLPGSGTGPGPATRLRSCCADAAVLVEDGAFRVERAGDDALDLLRAAAQAAWARADGVPAAAGPVTDHPDPAPVLNAIRRLDPAAGWAR